MAQRYQQFLGSVPGMKVELVSDESSPYLVRTEDGLEYHVSAEDFKTYYKKVDEPTPPAWRHLLTDKQSGTVDSVLMGRVMREVTDLMNVFRDFDRAREFAREALTLLKDEEFAGDVRSVRDRLVERGWTEESLTEEVIERLKRLDPETANLLMDPECGVIPFLDIPPVTAEDNGSPRAPSKKRNTEIADGAGPKALAGAKNVELTLDGDTLKIDIDLTKDFGPSKSGKTIIVASTSGNKKIPGREERIGLTVYRQEAKRPAVGRKQEFKNMTMDVAGDRLTITVDLSQDLGPSKSGITRLVASTGGNQLVFGRQEKIGLNIYRNA